MTRRALIVVAVLWAGAGCRKQPRSPPPPAPEHQPATALLILIEAARVFMTPDVWAAARTSAKLLATGVQPNRAGVSFYAANYIDKISLGPVAGVNDIDAIHPDEFKNERNRGFIAAVEAALMSLERAVEKRKILVVISDGIEGTSDRRQIAPLVERARRSGIIILALHLQLADDPSDGAANMRALGELGSFATASTPDELVQRAEQLRDTLP